MTSFNRAAGAGLVALVATAGVATVAGGGCNSTECYEKVRQPDTYATVERPVVVRPGHTEVIHHPAAVLDRVKKVEVVPGQWQKQHVPAVHGTMTKAVLVRPARVSYEHVPAVRQRIVQDVVVKPAHVRWERQRDAFGRERMCKVVVPAVTKSVERDVMVSPAQKIARTVPAEYRTVAQPVQLAPARTSYAYQPPVHQYVSQPMVVRPATQEVIHHPAVMGSSAITCWSSGAAMRGCRSATGEPRSASRPRFSLTSRCGAPVGYDRSPAPFEQHCRATIELIPSPSGRGSTSFFPLGGITSRIGGGEFLIPSRLHC